MSYRVTRYIIALDLIIPSIPKVKAAKFHASPDCQDVNAGAEALDAKIENFMRSCVLQ